MTSKSLDRLFENFLEAANTELPLPVAIRELITGESDMVVRQRMARLAAALEAGDPAEKAIEDALPDLPEHLRALLRNGHESGRLLDLLQIARRLFIQQEAFHYHIKTALAMAGALPGVLVGLIIFIGMAAMLSFEPVYEFYNYELPAFLALLREPAVQLLRLPSKYAFVLSVVLVGGLGFAGYGLMNWLLHHQHGRLPVLGKLHQIAVEHFMGEALQTLLSHNIPLHEALFITADCLPAGRWRVALNEVAQAVSGGTSIKDALFHRTEFSSMFRDTLILGVRAGNPGPSLENLVASHQLFLKHEAPGYTKAVAQISYAMLGVWVAFTVLVFFLAYWSTIDLANRM